MVKYTGVSAALGLHDDLVASGQQEFEVISSARQLVP
jgi:hypothetical protein